MHGLIIKVRKLDLGVEDDLIIIVARGRTRRRESRKITAFLEIIELFRNKVKLGKMVVKFVHLRVNMDIHHLLLAARHWDVGLCGGFCNHYKFVRLALIKFN